MCDSLTLIFSFCFIVILLTFHLYAPHDFSAFCVHMFFPFPHRGNFFRTGQKRLLCSCQYEFFLEPNSCPIFKSVHSDSLTYVSGSLPRRFPSFFPRTQAAPHMPKLATITSDVFLHPLPTVTILIIHEQISAPSSFWSDLMAK